MKSFLESILLTNEARSGYRMEGQHHRAMRNQRQRRDGPLKTLASINSRLLYEYLYYGVPQAELSSILPFSAVPQECLHCDSTHAAIFMHVTWQARALAG